VGSGDDLAGLSLVLGIVLTRALLWRLLGGALAALCASHLCDGHVQGLLLGGLLLDCGFEHNHLILQRLQGLHLDFNGVKATKDGVERGFDGGRVPLDGL
jgi:hypothetical protein